MKPTSSLYSKDLQVALLSNSKERVIFLITVLSIFLLTLSLEYQNYKEFSHFSSNLGVFRVLNHYEKEDYSVLKLETKNGYSFYTTSKDRFINLKGYRVKAEIFIKDEFYFLDYLKGSFHKSEVLALESELEYRFTLQNLIMEQHSSKMLGELYSTILFATPIGNELREHLSRLGVSHLAVLSGFHISFITAILFFLLRVIYSPIHRRFFPYRNSYRDIVVVTGTFIFSYLIFIDSPPSFLRAVAMFLIGAILFDRNLLKANFETLLYASILLIALFPKLIFAVGFWFSVAGVFYIFLFLKLFKSLNAVWQIIFINFWVFLAMLPITHSIFSEFYFSQLLSPLWTILFIAIYPAMIIVTLSPYPELIDPIFESFFSIESGELYSFDVSTLWLTIYIAFSLSLLKVDEVKNFLKYLNRLYRELRPHRQ